MIYKVYDEDHELMRIVGRKEEAEALVAIRDGWTWEAKRPPTKPRINLNDLEEALI